MSIERVNYDQSFANKVVLPPEDKQPDYNGMRDYGAIGVFDNFVKWEFCDAIIDSFEFWYGKKHVEEVKVCEVEGKKLSVSPLGDGSKQFNEYGDFGRKDQQLYLEICDPSLAMKQWVERLKFMQRNGKGY